MIAGPDKRRMLSLQEDVAKGISNGTTILEEGEDESGTGNATKSDPIRRKSKKENKK